MEWFTLRHVAALFLLIWGLGQLRMCAVYLGLVPNSLGITGSPALVRIAAISVLRSLASAAIIAFVSWPVMLT